MKKYIVQEMTEVNTSSIEFPDVPYFVYLLEDTDGKRILWKSSKRFKHKEKINISQTGFPKPITIGIIGSGVTGCGIAAIALKSGCTVILFVRNKKNNDAVERKITKLLLALVGQDQTDKLINLFTITDSIECLIQSELIIEAIDENLLEKQRLYTTLENTVNSKTIIATNTSSFSIDQLASRLHNKSRFIGMHFFNPVTKMSLVEIVKGKYTSEKTVSFIQKVVSQFGKRGIVVQTGKEGFIVNRLLFAYLSEAIKLSDEKVASIHDIDSAIELGLNHPLGPFKLMDLIGIDICLDILHNLSHVYTKPASLKRLQELKMKGLLGKKTERGFYRYNNT